MSKNGQRSPNPTPASTRDERRTAGDERNAYWRGLTPAQQRADLDRRLGKGVGAKRQREKLKEAVA